MASQSLATESRYIEVRRYKAPLHQVPEILRRAQEGFLPIVRAMPGFVAYYAVDLGVGHVTFINIFETLDQSVASTEEAARWAAVHYADLDVKRTDVLEGEVAFSAERG
ncbi:MAG: hypothetical protein HYU66_28510 [Armatimonadetes bacterium]|nr:hypothetical protein [Armatimonadota bacterium]